MQIKTMGGTTFTVEDGNVTITRHDQPECTVPEDDMEEFFDEYFNPFLEEDEEEDEE